MLHFQHAHDTVMLRYETSVYCSCHNAGHFSMESSPLLEDKLWLRMHSMCQHVL